VNLRKEGGKTVKKGAHIVAGGIVVNADHKGKPNWEKGSTVKHLRLITHKGFQALTPKEKSKGRCILWGQRNGGRAEKLIEKQE